MTTEARAMRWILLVALCLMVSCTSKQIVRYGPTACLHGVSKAVYKDRHETCYQQGWSKVNDEVPIDRYVIVYQRTHQKRFRMFHRLYQFCMSKHPDIWCSYKKRRRQ